MSVRNGSDVSVENFYLLLFIWFSGFHSVNAGNFQHVLSKPSGGNAVVVVPGGEREMLTCCNGNKVELVLKTRKGFVKQAIMYG